jgi:glycosyltransferase involved in cell wall biosynthesis
MKTKILAYMDTPSCSTGFGTVARNILTQLHKTGKYDIDIFGINYHGMPTPFQKIFNMWPALDPVEGDPYGRKRFCHHAMRTDFDILFIIQDTFIVDFLPELIPALKAQMNDTNINRKPFRSIMYYPTDSIIKPMWYYNISFVDKLISYTDFGKQEAIKARDILQQQLTGKEHVEIDMTTADNIDVIYHGVDSADFYPLPEAEVASFRKHYFKDHAEKFIFINVSRNQQRKDIPRNLMAFQEFRKQRPDSLLYLHMATKDQGWNIQELCRNFDLELGKDVILPKDFEPNQGYPLEVVNMLYNCADCSISTSQGEGYGLQWIESMACNTPVLMPDNTAMTELITDDRGYLAASGTDANLWTSVPNDNDILRPLVDVHDMVSKMIHIYDNYDEAKAKAKNAYLWVNEEMQWGDKIADQWQDQFKALTSELQAEMTQTVDNNTIKVEAF